jgi:Fmp27, WPPW motif-containing RBG unit
MHQREEETYLNQREGDEHKIIRHKPFSAVDVVITGIDLRALFAVFAEPQKKNISLKESLPSVTRFWDDLDPIPLSSTWLDIDDFKEIDWLPSDKEPSLYLHETAHCPRFVYFKRTPRTAFQRDGCGTGRSNTKFGEEETHKCLMGKEPSGSHVSHIALGLTKLL